MKVAAKDLFEIVRQVVRDEVQKVLPEMVREHLSESYIRRMVSESSQPKKGLKELLAPVTDESEEIPVPLKNSDRGIYNPDNLNKNKNEAKRRLSKDLGPLAFVLEDVKLPGDEGTTPDVPINTTAPEFSHMTKILEAVSERSAPMRESVDAKMRELEMKRKMLEVPVKK